MFPRIAKESSLNLVTNPHQFQLASGLDFLGTSGQNVHDLHMFSCLGEPIELLRLLLEMRHVCPTCPDTLRSFPFREEDPFVISGNAPDVFFAGCQPKYQEQIIY